MQKQRLVEEINSLLEQQGPLVPVLRKAIRLAKLSRDLENQSLFELHLDGVSEISGIRAQSWPANVKPKWDFATAFLNDRAMKNGKIHGSSIEQLERLISGIKEARNMAQAQGVPVSAGIKEQLELQELITRIRNRVGNFVVQVEDSMSIESVSNQTDSGFESMQQQKRIFLGHGGSVLWRDLKDFLTDRLTLPWDEFNREPVAGKSNKERLQEMLENASFAFLIMTAEDEHANRTMHARENVIHEIGLFQGRLGFSKAIVLVEEGCAEFSNIHGLTQIRFPKGNILAKSEEIRRVLEREGILDQGRIRRNLEKELAADERR